ncbi:30S ribosomal protein S6 [Candidatus Berkelbacteria bacterium RIFOXYA2_FULL_43_10]|uniref:Small ribosomal subunit protein bS6 n=1 Tax=Candidatus Berkelbacteria bacterium RIFOXYA2_FULL_43_10 TaxID=1797472 RepID=A0A1F5E6U0_9BACT|nr:MAG: 30S ribosomal protein S6 [Candidatus Berkelbacteria bacterium RIFOXYA2_FULL_43_10]
MRQYELTYLVSDSVSDSDITKVSGKVNAAISGGKILKEDNWGRRKLAYNIQKQQFATYIMLHFELEPEHLSELEHELKVSPEVIRHLLIVKDFGKEKLELTADEIAATEDIEEAAGSEKSFEVVEGETEESRDLMAKREKGEDAEEANKDDPNRHLPDRQAGESSPQIDTNEESSTDIKKKVEGESKDEVDAKVEAKTDIESEKAVEKTEKPKKPVAVAKIIDKDEEELKTPAKKKVVKKVEKKETTEEAADRLTKLDKELDDILGDEL